MKYLDPSSHVVLPTLLTVNTATADLLLELAADMGISLDELLSALAEDSVIALASSDFGDVTIPDRCSKQDLMDSIP
tara:strand:- start:331 stop:561 length:231 start_codon:yes stop_codon:yes gene_type:complete